MRRISFLGVLCLPWMLVLSLTSTGDKQVYAQAGALALERLPNGKSVTIPRPATTLVPLSNRVSLTATDRPQSVSFKIQNTAGGVLLPLRIAIYDSNQERVQYVDLKPFTPFLYSFKEVGGKITVVPEQKNTSPSYASMRLVVESDKPLEIAH